MAGLTVPRMVPETNFGEGLAGIGQTIGRWRQDSQITEDLQGLDYADPSSIQRVATRLASRGPHGVQMSDRLLGVLNTQQQRALQERQVKTGERGVGLREQEFDYAKQEAAEQKGVNRGAAEWLRSNPVPGEGDPVAPAARPPVAPAPGPVAPRAAVGAPRAALAGGATPERSILDADPEALAARAEVPAGAPSSRAVLAGPAAPVAPGIQGAGGMLATRPAAAGAPPVAAPVTPPVATPVGAPGPAVAGAAAAGAPVPAATPRPTTPQEGRHYDPTQNPYTVGRTPAPADFLPMISKEPAAPTPAVESDRQKNLRAYRNKLEAAKSGVTGSTKDAIESRNSTGRRATEGFQGAGQGDLRTLKG